MDIDINNLENALKIFDETTRALDARARRLEQVLTAKQLELQETNQKLNDKVEELDSMSTYLNSLMSSISSGVISVDTEGKIITCNPVAEKILNHIEPSPKNKDYSLYFESEALQKVLKEGIPSEPFERTIEGEEEDIITKVMISPLINNEGKLLGAVEAIENVTKVKELQKLAERREKLASLGEMAAGVAHEIRNPLNGIEGFASLIQRDTKDNPSLQKYSELVVTGVRHLNKTVTNLLEFTSPKEAKVREFPLIEIMNDCVNLVNHEDDSQIIMEIKNTISDENISFDPTHFRQIMINIIQNAKQAATENEEVEPKVLITINKKRKKITVSIEDNGLGIEESKIKNIFTPFFTTKDTGTGLGLSIAHTLAGLNNAILGVEKSQLGGAKFTLVV